MEHKFRIFKDRASSDWVLRYGVVPIAVFIDGATALEWVNRAIRTSDPQDIAWLIGIYDLKRR